SDLSATDVAPTFPAALTVTCASSSLVPALRVKTTCSALSPVRASPGSAKLTTVPGSRVHEAAGPAPAAGARRRKAATMATATARATLIAEELTQRDELLRLALGSSREETLMPRGRGWRSSRHV